MSYPDYGQVFCDLHTDQRKKHKECHRIRTECAFSWYVYFLQFSSVAQSCLTLCDHTDCSTPGLPVHHHFPELTQTHVHGVGDAIQPSHPLSSPSSHLRSFPASGSFPMSQFLESRGQSIGVSASSSVLPMNIQDWFPFGWTGWISLLFKEHSRLSSTTVRKHSL